MSDSHINEGSGGDSLLLVLLIPVFFLSGIYIHNWFGPPFDDGSGFVFWSSYTVAFLLFVALPVSVIVERLTRCPHGVRGGRDNRRCHACVEEAAIKHAELLRNQIQRHSNSLFSNSKRGRRTNSESPCESPIEETFWRQLRAEIDPQQIPLVKPQHQVGPYRIDFAIPSKLVAIELDGHDFHKTKEQRTSDAQRQRYLQKQGWVVVRFTGTEVSRSARKCVDDVIQIATLTRIQQPKSDS